MKKPSEGSSKERVSRLRAVPGLNSKSKVLYQDPRFDGALGEANMAEVRKNYAFLDSYREREISDMKQELRKTRDPEARENLRLAIQSQSSRLETMRRRDQDSKAMSQVQHERISRAKKREFVLQQRFETMSNRDKAKSVEKRRRKVAQKQKRALPERRD